MKPKDGPYEAIKARNQATLGPGNTADIGVIKVQTLGLWS